MSSAEVPATFTSIPAAGRSYVALTSTPPTAVAETVEVLAILNVDLSEGGRLLGFEIIGALPGTIATPEENR
ncbi:DUF2283 domain-containing protein [Streptosporangium sp. NPDC050855]|uniref:DUF2283 domain-containing protein n=1 Tax=Streptosporangium sp. NPDC050855 TaxID=3366194 RepID=UPI00379EB13F